MKSVNGWIGLIKRMGCVDS
jgi:hypothetical protein